MKFTRIAAALIAFAIAAPTFAEEAKMATTTGGAAATSTAVTAPAKTDKKDKAAMKKAEKPAVKKGEKTEKSDKKVEEKK